MCPGSKQVKYVSFKMSQLVLRGLINIRHELMKALLTSHDLIQFSQNASSATLENTSSATSENASSVRKSKSPSKSDI